jgi:Sulfotransferase domain
VTGDGPLPTFLIIGAQKSATRWLRTNLGAHPDIFVAQAELEFFNKDERFRRGVDWYRTQFDDWAGEPIVGEATPGYMFWREQPAVIATRIHEVVPEVRLLALLRNPIERAQSAMVHHIKFSGLPPDCDVVELVRHTPPEEDPLGIISGGWYAASLAAYSERFGERLRVLLYDDIEDDPVAAYVEALCHVGAVADFVPPDVDQVRFSNQRDPSRAPIAPKVLTLEERCQLYSFFAEDIARLESMLGRDLASWRPDCGALATPS